MTENTESMLKQIIQRLEFNRPSISKNTVKTYTSRLVSLLRAKDETARLVDWNWIENESRDVVQFINEHFSHSPAGSVKSIYTSLYAVTNNPIYQGEMMQLLRGLNEQSDKQEMTDKQEKNWMSYDEVKMYLQAAKSAAQPYWGSKVPLEGQPLQIVQRYVLMSLVCGTHIPPRRAQDWTEFKIRGVPRKASEAKTCNYMRGGRFHFLIYKSSKAHGEQIVEIPSQLKTILAVWKRLNPSEYLLVGADGVSQCTTPRVSFILNSVFGKSISVSMLRHIYLTTKYGDNIPLSEMQEDARVMAHSVGMQQRYVLHPKVREEA